MSWFDVVDSLVRGNESLKLDVYCYAPFIFGWTVIVFAAIVVLGVLEWMGYVEKQTDEAKNESQMVGYATAIVGSVVAILSPIIALGLLLASFFGFDFYSILFPPQRIVLRSLHVSVFILTVYTGLVLCGVVHERPRFLFKFDWGRNPAQMVDRIKQNYPLTSNHLAEYIRSDNPTVRTNVLHFINPERARPVTDPESIDILLERLENEQTRQAHEMARTILYSQQSQGWLSSEQLARLGKIERSGAADRFGAYED